MRKRLPLRCLLRLSRGQFFAGSPKMARNARIVRVERRIETGGPDQVGERTELMFELMALAFQAGTERV